MAGARAGAPVLVLLLALALPALSPARTIPRETERRRTIPRQCDSYAFPSRDGRVGLFLVLIFLITAAARRVLARGSRAWLAGAGRRAPRCWSCCCSAARILAPFPLSFQITVLLYGGFDGEFFAGCVDSGCSRKRLRGTAVS